MISHVIDQLLLATAQVLRTPALLTTYTHLVILVTHSFQIQSKMRNTGGTKKVGWYPCSFV